MIVTDTSDKMLTVKEVAGLLNIHPNTLRRWSEQGRIVTYKINSRGDRRFKRSDIEKFLDEFNPYK
jgi:excisionase family DNA binding protein